MAVGNLVGVAHVQVGDLDPFTQLPFDLAAVFQGCAYPPSSVLTTLGLSLQQVNQSQRLTLNRSTNANTNPHACILLCCDVYNITRLALYAQCCCVLLVKLVPPSHCVLHSALCIYPVRSAVSMHSSPSILCSGKSVTLQATVGPSVGAGAGKADSRH